MKALLVLCRCASLFFAITAIYVGSKHSITVVYLFAGFAAAYIGQVILSRKVRQANRQKKTVFAGKDVTVVIYDGKKIAGRIDCEPSECAEYIVLTDARIEDDSAAIPDAKVYDKIAIPAENVQSLLLEDLDKV